MGALAIDSNVPFSESIDCWLHLGAERRLQTLVRESALFERQFLAWETIRKGRNPYFMNGTGFEGYLVGVCQSAEEALDSLLGLAQGMLNSISRLHRLDSRFRSRLMKTVTGELSDLEAMAEWSAQLGAALAILRCHLLYERKTADFQLETYRVVRSLPPICYWNGDHIIRQRYVVYIPAAPCVEKTTVNVHALKPDDQDAWLILQSVGKFGHPLLREFLRFSTN